MSEQDDEHAARARQQIATLVGLLRLVHNALDGIAHGLETTAGVHSVVDGLLVRLQEGEPVNPAHVADVRQALKELEIAAGVDGIATLRSQLALIVAELAKAFEIE
jgi:hypothetical protein